MNSLLTPLHTQPILYPIFNDTMNGTNSTLNQTQSPIASSTTFQTSFHYYTTPSVPNGTSLSITLQFHVLNDSMNTNIISFHKLTATFRFLLQNELILNEYSDSEVLEAFNLRMSSNLTLNTSNILEIEWILQITEHELDLLFSEYITSSRFTLDFNALIGDIDLILSSVQINGENVEITESTEIPWSQWTSSEIEIETEHDIDESIESQILPGHLREFMFVYVAIFGVTVIALSCYGYWCCATRCYAVWLRRKEERDKMGGQRYTANGVPIRKWDDINEQEAEFMMKAFDDDEALYSKWYSEDTNGHIFGDADFQIMRPEPTEKDYGLTMKQKMEIHSAFDE